MIALIPTIARYAPLDDDDSPAAAVMRHDDSRARARALHEAIGLIRATPTDVLVSYLPILARYADDPEATLRFAGSEVGCCDPAG